MTNKQKKLGVALSGGGARGLAHIGLLKAFEEAGIQIDYMAGTSMGGIIGAAYASGMTPDEIEELTHEFKNFRDVMKLMDFRSPGSGILRGEQLEKFFEDNIGDSSFEELRIPFTIVTTDIRAGREVHITEGRVIDALRATIAVPGVFSPKENGKQRLIDGGLLNNMPVDVVYKMGADVAVGVDVMTASDEAFWQMIKESKLMPNALSETITVIGECVNTLLQNQVDQRIGDYPEPMVIRPRIPSGITMFTGFNRAEESIAAGREAVESALDELKERLGLIQMEGQALEV